MNEDELNGDDINDDDLMDMLKNVISEEDSFEDSLESYDMPADEASAPEPASSQNEVNLNNIDDIDADIASLTSDDNDATSILAEAGATAASSSFNTVTDDELASILSELGVEDPDPVIDSAVDATPDSSDTPAPAPVAAAPVSLGANAVISAEVETSLAEAATMIAEATTELGDDATVVKRPRRSYSSGGTKHNKSQKFATKKVAMGLVAAIVLVAGAGLAAVAVITNQPPVDLNVEQPIVVTQNHVGSQSANFIFISEQRSVGSNNFFMSRMLLDQFATIFYFDTDINWDNYTPQLIDDQGRAYRLSLSHFTDTTTNRLSFEPLYPDSRGVILSITDNATQETAQFPLEFYGHMFRLPAFYLNTVSEEVLGDSSIRITGGHFSSAASVIFYEIAYGDSSFAFDNIFLNTGVLNLPVRTHQYFDMGDNVVIGRLEFEPVASVSGAATIVFSNAFVTYPINQSVPVQELFANTRDSRIEIPIGENTLVLERMGRRADDIILVLHGRGADGIRRETRLDATLQVANAMGNISVLEPRTFSGPQGSDMLFDIFGTIGSVNESQLLIETAHFGGTNFILDLDLNAASGMMNASDAMFIESTEEVFFGMGYNRAEVIAYTFANVDFSGVFRVSNDIDIHEYIVRAERADQGWNFVVTRID